MALREGEVCQCPDPGCGCELTVTKAPQPGAGGDQPPTCCFRTLNLVTWQDERSARELRSAAEVRAAEGRGDVTVRRPGVVVNMPMVTWPGGQR